MDEEIKKEDVQSDIPETEEKCEAAEEVRSESCEQCSECEHSEKEDKKEGGRKFEKKLKAELGETQKKLSEQTAKNAELTDMYKRLLAEFDNYKKRTARELDGRYQDAKFDTVKNILPVLDNFERALKTEAPEECRQYMEGVEMTFTQLKGILEGFGVREIDALGQKFDPQYHNAVLHTDDDSVPENTVVEVFEKGYTLGDKVLRYSIVKVAN